MVSSSSEYVKKCGDAATIDRHSDTFQPCDFDLRPFEPQISPVDLIASRSSRVPNMVILGGLQSHGKTHTRRTLQADGFARWA